MANLIRDFLRGSCYLVWYNNALFATPPSYSNGSTTPRNSQALSINAIAKHLLANKPLDLTTQEEGELLGKLFLNLDLFEVSPAIQTVRDVIRIKWFNAYPFSNQAQVQLAQWYVQAMNQRVSYHFINQTQCYGSLTSFLNLYQGVPSAVQAAIKKLCSLYPQVFSACHDPESHGYALARLLEKNDPLIGECLIKIARYVPPKGYKNILKNWIAVQKKLLTLPFDSTLGSLAELYQCTVPPEWILRTLKELFFFADVNLHPAVLAALVQKPSFFDFYYFIRVGSAYDHEAVREKFPLEAPPAATYLVPSYLPPDKCARYEALMHQSVLSAADSLKKGWNLDKLIAYLMLRSNFTALSVGEKEEDKIAVPGPVLGYCLRTPCLPPLAAELKTRLANGPNPHVFVKKEGEVYELRAALNQQHFVHTTILINGEKVCLDHPKHPQTRKQILQGVSQLFEQARSEPNREEFVKKLGLIFWWIIRSKFWLGGELAIAEGVIRSLAMAKGMPHPRWKSAGVAAVDEVFKCFDPDEFAAKFHSFFEGLLQ